MPAWSGCLPACSGPLPGLRRIPPGRVLPGRGRGANWPLYCAAPGPGCSRWSWASMPRPICRSSASCPNTSSSTTAIRSLAAAAWVALAIWANAAGNLTGGWLGHRGAPRWLLMIVALATMGTAGWLTYQPGFSGEARLVFAFVFSGVGGLLPSSIFGSVTRHAPDPHPRRRHQRADPAEHQCRAARHAAIVRDAGRRGRLAAGPVADRGAGRSRNRLRPAAAPARTGGLNCAPTASFLATPKTGG